MPASKVRGEAPGKLILFGEHAVVYGAPALGMPLSRPAVAELGPGTGQVSLRLAKGLEAEASPHAAQPTDLVARVLGPRMQQLDVRLTLYFPPMSGFGSSAAIVVAILRALEVLDGKPPAAPRRLLARTMDAEAVAHARPSGVDPAICLWGAPIRFQREGERMKVKALKVASPATLVVGAAGAHGGTRQTVSRLGQLRDTDGGLIKSAMNTLGAASEAGEKGLAKGDLARVGRAMDVAQGVLAGLGLVQEPVHRAVQVVRTAGALGAKMSGAGGAGGAFYALFEDKAGARRAVKALAEAGVPAWLESLE